ncbi:hypothetical protein BGP77_04040 [Saccharospirillum sp. MSK14-1]|uniref:hypothetical protein n=1 Tax=Saccharospirillum sp. MSK14-1 TaxID=1897632 RepID=UPI000D3DAAE0|nr:hypothetical protein [Saccharospirillum sp. MSK14-1]PTY36478.1 hypothetical protein BGP77_04040 [Saccharospirillum sp. MSK14-1]
MALIINNVNIVQAQGEPTMTTTSSDKIITGEAPAEIDLSQFSPASEVDIETLPPGPTPEEQEAAANAKLEALRYGWGPLSDTASTALAKTEQLEGLVSGFIPELEHQSWDLSVDAKGDTVVLGALVTDEQAALIKTMVTSLGLDDAMADYRDGVLEMMAIRRSGLGPAGTWDVTAGNFSDVFRFREFTDDTLPPFGPFWGNLNGNYLNTLTALERQLTERASRIPEVGFSAYA